MCMFSRHVELVASTKIFARGLADGSQVLAYAMDVAAPEPLAMVLPLPVPAGGGEDAISFVNLEGYAELFDDLKRAFPALGFGAQPASRGFPEEQMLSLEVHQVGAFEASYVPHPRDFARLDPRFQLPPNVLAQLPQYADWGFAVFQLAASPRTPIHPMALRFPRRDPRALFFPTVHVHDGSVPAQAMFDHQLFAQLDPVTARVIGWTPSTGPLGGFVDGARAHGLVDGAAGGHTQMFVGPLPNRDVVLCTPPVTLDDLEGRGETYAYQVQATYHFAAVSHHAYPRWLDTAANRLPGLCRGIRDGLAELATRNARAWQLGPLTDALPPYFMNGDQLWRGTSYMDGARVEARGPGRIAFRPFGTLVEPQAITLGFAELPSEDDARAINRALAQLLDRIAGDA